MKFRLSLRILVIVLSLSGLTMTGEKSAWADSPTEYTSFHSLPGAGGLQSFFSYTGTQAYFNKRQAISAGYNKFRIFIPPGAYYLFVSVYVDRDSNIASAAHLGIPPIDGTTYDMALYSPPSNIAEYQRQDKNVVVGNGGGAISSAVISPIGNFPGKCDLRDRWLYVSIYTFTPGFIKGLEYSMDIETSQFQSWYSKMTTTDWTKLDDVSGDRSTSFCGTGYSCQNASCQAGEITPQTYSISGYAGVGNAAITYTGGSTTADSSGNYSFTVSSGWSGTVTPSKSGYTFTPLSKTYSSISSNQTSQNFTATPVSNSFTISGYVRNSSSVGIQGVTITPSSGATAQVTNDIGYYSLTVASGWSGTVTPSKSGYTFTTKTYSSVVSNQTDQNFTGTVVSCSEPWTCWAFGQQCQSDKCVNISTSLPSMTIVSKSATVPSGVITKSLSSSDFSSTKSVLEPTVTFSTLPGASGGQYDLYAAIVENNSTIYVATKDKVGNTVFVDYRNGVDTWFRSFERRTIISGQTITFYPFNGVDLNLTSSSCGNYQFFVGIVPAGTTLTTANFSSVCYGAVFQCQ